VHIIVVPQDLVNKLSTRHPLQFYCHQLPWIVGRSWSSVAVSSRLAFDDRESDNTPRLVGAHQNPLEVFRRCWLSVYLENCITEAQSPTIVGRA
jgi:hypothetical protein